MEVKSAVLRIIVNNSGSIGAIFGCASVLPSNMILILVVIVATILLVIVIYEISSTVVAINAIGRMMVEIMVMVMTIVLGGHSFCCLAFLGR